MPRKLFVTTALPYANGPFHIGHIMEYIQADIWVRFQRMQGHEVHFVGADDAHGAPIMIAAEKAGKTPQAFVAEIAAGRKQYLDGFHIAFDNWHSTDAPENHALAQDIYRALRRNGLVFTREIEQFFDPVKSMFLPDRYIKGECPKCGAKDQYGDSCEVCGAVYAPTELVNPYSALSGAVPVRLRPGQTAEATQAGARLIAGAPTPGSDRQEPVAATTPVDAPPATLLAADNLPLAAVLQYASERSAVPIRLADPALGRRPVTGRFDVADARSLARKLAAALDLELSEDGGTLILSLPGRKN